MRILLLEDDHEQASWIRSELEREFHPTVRVVRTELEFRDILPELAASPPDIAVLDVIVRWTDPAPEIVKPSDDVQQGPSRAGIRCARFLSDACPTTPIILYTVLAREDLEEGELSTVPNVLHLQKEASPRPLFDRVRSLTERD